MKTTKPTSYDVLGTRVDALSLEDGLKAAENLINSKGCHYIVLPYVEFVMQARQEPAVAKALDGADLSLPNGVGLNWSIQYQYGGKLGFWRWLRTGLSVIFKPSTVHDLAPARFDSANFSWKLLEWAAENNKTVCLIGSPKQQSIEQTAKHLERAIPVLDVVATYPGKFNPASEIRLVQELKQTKPDLILVGMGFPAQELLMQKLKGQLSHGLMIGEGGSFDYQQFGGQIKRAPAWIRRIGMEWFWRLLREPSRLRRQLAIPRFIWQVYRSKPAR